MVNAAELRIGNWIQVLGIYKDSFRKVGLIQCDAELIKLCADGKIGLLGVDLIPEILEKCGFVHYNKVYRLESFIIKDDFTELYCPGEKGAMEKSFFVNCQYLHQLQNLYFAIEYEELQVENLMPEN